MNYALYETPTTADCISQNLCISWWNRIFCERESWKMICERGMLCFSYQPTHHPLTPHFAIGCKPIHCNTVFVFVLAFVYTNTNTNTTNPSPSSTDTSFCYRALQPMHCNTVHSTPLQQSILSKTLYFAVSCFLYSAQWVFLNYSAVSNISISQCSVLLYTDCNIDTAQYSSAMTGMKG